MGFIKHGEGKVLGEKAPGEAQSPQEQAELDEENRG